MIGEGNLTYQQEELIADLISTYGEQIIYITNKIFNKLNDKGKI